MTVEELLEKYKRKYPGVPYEISRPSFIYTINKNRRYHSFNDAPAIVWFNGEKKWFKKGKLHRENDKPAFIYSNGTKVWYYEGKRHRENDKPAIIDSRGNKRYYYHGKEYDPTDTPEKRKKQIKRLTPKKTSKQKTREDLLKEFVVEVLET